METAAIPGAPGGSPSYLALGLDELRDRARRAVEGLAECRFCPRDCGVNRLEDRRSACKTGRRAIVSSHFPHFGEEDCLRGWNGSGTIFFAHCNLRCVFCQNHSISQGIRPGPGPAGSTPEEIAGMMLELQDRGCHNINFVTPEHVVPQVLEAVAEAAARGLRLPIVYNTSACDCLESLELMDGVVDVYMPDFKFWSEERSRIYMSARAPPSWRTTARFFRASATSRPGPSRLARQVAPQTTGEALRTLAPPPGSEPPPRGPAAGPGLHDQAPSCAEGSMLAILGRAGTEPVPRRTRVARTRRRRGDEPAMDAAGRRR